MRIGGAVAILLVLAASSAAQADSGFTGYYCPDGTYVSASQYPEACYDHGLARPGSGGGSGSSSDALSDAMAEGIINLFRETPQQQEERIRREAEQRRIEEENARRRAEEERRERIRQQGLEAEAQEGLGLASQPVSASDEELLAAPKDHPADSLPRVACREGGGIYVCNTPTCGGTSMKPVCCPQDFPILNTCDCQCYRRGAKLECSQYTACQYSDSYKEPKP